MASLRQNVAVLKVKKQDSVLKSDYLSADLTFHSVSILNFIFSRSQRFKLFSLLCSCFALNYKALCV